MCLGVGLKSNIFALNTGTPPLLSSCSHHDRKVSNMLLVLFQMKKAMMTGTQKALTCHHASLT